MCDPDTQPCECPPLVAYGDDDMSLRIADVTMLCRAKPGDRTPTWDAVRNLVLDQPTAETLRFLAQGLSIDANVLLEGETGTSKSAAVVYLAALTRHELMRINLNGQTDAGELVGRFMPNPRAGLRRADLEPHLGGLRPDSRIILDQADGAGRELDVVDRLRLAALEGWSVTIEQPWVFREGLVVEALRHGAWVLLDEVNLAETSILERINAVLDQPRTLVLTEHDGTRFGAGGDVAIAPGFRMLATMNPAEYAGRGQLSDAFVNRWTLVRAVRRPGEADYRALLRGLVLREAPVVEVAGKCWCGRVERPAAAPPARQEYETLRQLAHVELALDGLALLHTKIVVLSLDAGKGVSTGAGRRQRYSFTRRDLITALDLMDQMAVDCGDAQAILLQAIDWVYLQRIADEADRARIRELMGALAIYGGSWPVEAVPALSARLAPGPAWQSWSGHLGPAAVAVFRLFLAAGSPVELTTSPPEGGADGDTVLELRTADDRLVARDDDGGEGLTSRLRYTAPADGEHVLRLYSIGRVHGAFCLAYCCPAAAMTRSLTPADNWQTVADRIPEGGPKRAAPGPRDFVGSAQAGERFDFSTSPSTGSGMSEFDSTLEVLTPAGARLAFDDDGGDGRTSLIRAVRIETTGDHRLRVRGCGGSHGAFRLAYRRTPAGDPDPVASRPERDESWAALREHRLPRDMPAATSIEPGNAWKRVDGRLEVSRPAQFFSFRGATGQAVVFSTSPSTGDGHASFDSVLDLYDSSGEWLAGDDDGGDGTTSRLETTLPLDGDYTLVVRPFARPTDGGIRRVFRLAFRSAGRRR